MTALAKDTSKFVETRIENEVVIMVLDNGDFFSLQDTARAIWELIDGSRDRDQVVGAVASDYGVAAADIAREVDAFVAELQSAGVVCQA